MFQLDFRRTPVTLTIAAIIIAIQAACVVDQFIEGDLSELSDKLYNTAKLGISPFMWRAPWQPLTTTLLHGGILHAVFNTYWLIYFGSFLEVRFGKIRFLLLTILLAYVSGILAFAFKNAMILEYDKWIPLLADIVPAAKKGWSGSVGFSGVIYGYFGLFLIGRRREVGFAALCPPQLVNFLLFWWVLCFALARSGVLNVDNGAHTLGLLFGAIYGMAIFERNISRRYVWIAAAIVLSIVAIAPMFIPPPVFFNPMIIIQ